VHWSLWQVFISLHLPSTNSELQVDCTVAQQYSTVKVLHCTALKIDEDMDARGESAVQDARS
jgi:hypothetical protein